MTSGARTDAVGAAIGRRRIVAAAALALLGGAALPAAAQGAGGFDLDALMALLARRRNGEARFTEERTVAGFEGPLRASGTLSFTAPDRFARTTLEPYRERMEVAGNQLRLERGGRVRQMSLDAVPELAALVEGLRGTLTGNAALLRRHFDVRLTGQARLWTLTLTPLDRNLAAQVRSLQIVGTAGELRTVELQLSGSDRSLMTIEPLAHDASAAPARPAAATPSAPAPAATAASRP